MSSKKDDFLEPQQFKTKIPLKLKLVSDLSDDENDENESDALDMKIDVKNLNAEHKVILNKCATEYDLEFGDMVKILLIEDQEKEELKHEKLMEEERAQYAGRKSRRERRLAKEKRLREKGGELSPLSYVMVEEPSNNNKNESDDDSESKRSSRSRSRSTSSSSSKSLRNKKKDNESKIISFITSFGAADENNQQQEETNKEVVTNLPFLTSNSLNKSISNIKKLKQNLVSARSRSRSRSPESSKKLKTIIDRAPKKESLQKNRNSDSESCSSDDEETALRKYLERRQNRKYIKL
jgi:hypothetical protein